MAKANKYTRDFYIEFTESVKQKYEIILCVATSGKILQTNIDYMESKPKLKTIQIGEIYYEVPIKFKYYGIPELVELHQWYAQDLNIKPVNTISIGIQQGSYNIPNCATGKELYDTLYTTIPAEELIYIRREIGTDLYTMNFRGPLGDQIAVNRDIVNTIKDLPIIFNVLNNGLAAICDNFKIDKTQEKATVDNFRIVNGCQTLETLYNHHEKVIGSPIKVNLRITVAQTSQGALIAKATNTQTRLAAEDFATLDPIQHKLSLG